MEQMNTSYSSYKGVWYRYNERNITYTPETWELTDGKTIAVVYDAEKYRIDQCFEMFKEHLENLETIKKTKKIKIIVEDKKAKNKKPSSKAKVKVNSKTGENFKNKTIKTKKRKI